MQGVRTTRGLIKSLAGSPVADHANDAGWCHARAQRSVRISSDAKLIAFHTRIGGQTMDEERQYYLLVKQAFDVLAPIYDIVTIPLLTDKLIRDRVVSFADARSGSRILDVATGTGKQAFAFGRRGYDVIGIDISEAMLKVAIRKNKYENVRFEGFDATNLAFEDNSFDVSCASFALHDMPLTIRERALKEMVRVTEATGMILIVDYALPQNKIGASLVRGLVELYEGAYYANFIESDLARLLSRIGVEIEGKNCTKRLG